MFLGTAEVSLVGLMAFLQFSLESQKVPAIVATYRVHLECEGCKSEYRNELWVSLTPTEQSETHLSNWKELEIFRKIVS